IFSNPQLAAQPPVNSILRIQGAFGSVVLDTFNANSGIGAVTYNREGFATTAAGFPNTTFFLNESTANGAYRRCLLLTPQGVPTTATHAINPALCP
ncbi:MAG: hypothetical protein JO005_00115, partial [Gammaproteobacteria bacterium]|nr:hypothetical protein [Gammaproteobacteria bacterium]